jgi:hypothetical protein
MDNQTPKQQFDSLLLTLRSDGFSDEEILDLFEATKLDWGGLLELNEITICDPHKTQNVLIKVSKGKKWKWQFGSAFTKEIDGQVRRLAAEIKSPHVHDFIMSRVLFSHRELTGSWSFDQHMQIVPCIAEMHIGSGLDVYSEARHLGASEFEPRPNGPPFPFLLEVSVPKLSNHWLQSKIGRKLLDQYQHLLCMLVVGVSANLLKSDDRSWTALKAKSGDGIEYHLLSAGIGLEKGGRYDDWTVFDKSAAVFAGDDYLDTLLLHKAQVLQLPNNLSEQFLAHYSLTKTIQSRFDRASYYFALGNALRTNHDLAILNYAIAIEAMLEPESGERCKECDKPKGAGPTKKFNDFITTYAPVSPELAPYQAKLYNVRSTIAHGSKSMAVDHSIFSLAKDSDTAPLMEWLVRKSLATWLSKRGAI